MGEARSDGGCLSTRKVRALVALLDSSSAAAAARKANVGERSIRRWIKEDASFRLKLRELRTELLTGTANKLQHDAFGAAEALKDLIQGKEKIEPGRAALIRTALDYAFKAGGYVDLVERVAALETPLEGEDDSRDNS